MSKEFNQDTKDEDICDESFEALKSLSKLLQTGLNEESLKVCVKLCKLGVNPEALAALINQLRQDKNETE
ncbi:Mitotic-spindle organizing protein 1 [Intoshia linei]|uniref:Mitotic-spindle organizing protein 1 n=1 Tax=Intoshia linei TaxID=1819745 RepID=A0A177BA48_9BILA|nr:Mitotic-spindle organizing protein 1 [Intoshia linei]